MTGQASHDRHGSHAGRGFRYQDAVAAWLCVRVWAGIDPFATIIPEGGDDVEHVSASGRRLVQVKSRRERLGALPIADVRDYINALWERNDRVSPAPAALELVIERPVVHHETRSDGWIAPSAPLLKALPNGARAVALLDKTSIRHVPEPGEASIAIIAERTGCRPLAAQICFSQILRQVGKLADENGLRQPANYLGMSASDTDLVITDALAVIDVAQIELAISSGVCEPVDFLTLLDDPDFYLGVDVQPGHVAAGLVVPRLEPREALERGLEMRGAALIAGPSGAGKSAIMWDTAHALRHTVRWYRLLRIDPRDMPAVTTLLKALRADLGSPVGFVVDDIGRRGAEGWDALTREFAAIPGALLLGSIREEDLFLVEGRSRAQEVRAEPDSGLAQRIFEELRRNGKTDWAGWQEPWTQSQGLVLEYTHILSAGRRFEDTLAEQVAARRRDPARGTELAALRLLSLAGAAGAMVDADRLASTLGAGEEDVARGLTRLIDEHLIREGDSGHLTGLHQLRSGELVRLAHAVPPPSIDVTFARTAQVVVAADLEPLVADALRNQGVNLPAAISALVSRLEREPDIDSLSAILRGLGTAYIAASAVRWLAMPNAQGLARTQVGTAVLLSLLSEPLPGVNANITLATAAGVDLAAIRSDTSADLRRTFLDALSADLIISLVSQTHAASTLNRFLAAQVGMPLHPNVQAALAAKPVDLSSGTIDAVAELLGTLAEIDRPLAIAWVDDLGEDLLVSRIRHEVSWAMQASFEDAPDGRVVRCDYHHIGLPEESDTHGAVVRICEIALGLSPRSDIAASVARAPNGETAGFNNLALAEKRIPRANLPVAAVPAWNRRWRDAIAIGVATPTYTGYLTRAAELIERLVGRLERTINLILQNKSIPDGYLSSIGEVFEAAEALTPPPIAAADAAGTGAGEFNPHVSKLQNLLYSASADLLRRFHGLPDGAGAYIAWTGDLIKSFDVVIRDEPWGLIGGAPPSLDGLRAILIAVRQIAEDVADGDVRPAAKFKKLLKDTRPKSPLRFISARISNATVAARRTLAVELQDALADEGFSAVVHVVEDADAILPWPPSRVVVLISIERVEQFAELFLAAGRARELVSELRHLIVIPIVDGVAVPGLGQAGYATMLQAPMTANEWAKRLKLPSSPSLAWTAFDRNAAIASALQSMDRLSLGLEGRSRTEIEKRGQLKGQLATGREEVEAILTALDQELADGALMLLDTIRTGEAEYADAVHAFSTTQEMRPILEHLLGLRILVEQAELTSLRVPVN